MQAMKQTMHAPVSQPEDGQHDGQHGLRLLKAEKQGHPPVVLGVGWQVGPQEVP